MIFRCENCGGNVIYDPKKKTMSCPYCDSEESEKKIVQEEMKTCINCGAPIEGQIFTSATKCSHCGTYVILDEMISKDNEPNLVLPFKIDKEEGGKILNDKFSKSIFSPSTFIKSKALQSVDGIYVPFWLYDYHTEANYEGIGIKIKRWKVGNKEYTETSKYAVARKIEVDYSRIPVDASNEMNDEIMNEIEPYQYEEILKFDPKFLSGFYAETYNETAASLINKANLKADLYTNQWISGSVSDYVRIEEERKDVNNTNTNIEFALFPVWIYTYKFMGKQYRYYVNGQTGEAIGKVPIDVKRIVGIGFLTFILIALFLKAFIRVWEVL